MKMVRVAWTQALFCLPAIAAPAPASSSSGKADGLTSGLPSATHASSVTETFSGTTTTYSVAFTVPADADTGKTLLPNIYDPHAKVAQSLCPGYTASNVQKTSTGFTASLSLAGDACNVYGTDIKDLSLSFDVQSAHRMNIQIAPTYLGSNNISHYILPSELVHQPRSAGSAQDVQDIDLDFTWSNDPTFSFKVTRKSTGDVLFDTTGSVLVYENQFIEFVTQLPVDYNLYGMGERIHGLRLGNNYTATFWAADVGDAIDANLYGNHPFYLDTRYYEVSNSTGKRKLVTSQDVSATGNYESYSHGVYQRNAHGLEALLRPTNLTWRALGGSIDLYFFDGPDQASVTREYQVSAVGLPAMQQYFSFGFHQCRWGYANWSDVENVVDNYRAFGVPLETVWTDIDWMFQYRDFENDPIRFPYDEGAAFLKRLNANGQHYVPIIDSAIYIPNPQNASDSYSIYEDGHQRNVFLHNADGSEYVGDVWPGYTVFPDWSAPETASWWADSLFDHHEKIPWSGIWLDMSEASSFCIGSCGTGNLSLNPVHPPFLLPGEPGAKIYNYPEGFEKTNASEAKIASSLAASQASSVAKATPPSTATMPYYTTTPTPGFRAVDYPPYVINNANGPLGGHAVSPDAVHADGVQEYDRHNLFGYQIINATYYGLYEKVFPGKRPFIIGRSTFAGTGKHGGHWGGDNTSLFAYMYFSISQALNFALFGIPMFGVDTCGFNGNSDEELCNRWMQLSAFFPFYRNHNTLSANSQEAYIWSSVIEASKTAMQIRYSLLPYMYTLFYLAHTHGSTVMRALSWEFVDPTLKAVDNQFLLGPSLMVVPALGQGQTEVQGVFPGVAQGEVWYDWYTQTAVDAKPGENKTIPAPLGHIPVFLRGGSILPQQEALYTTKQSRNSPWSLLCVLDGKGAAKGQLYIDDGESVMPDSTLLVHFTASRGTLSASIGGSYQDTNPLANITILGVASQPRSVALNGRNLTSSVAYNATSKVLSLKALQNQTSSGAWAQDWKLTWA